MKYRRNYVEGGTYFFTNLLDRDKTLLTDHIDLLKDAIHIIKKTRPFHIDALVILPDHLHTIWTFPENDSDYSSRWREIKKRFSKSLPETELRSEVRKQKGERGI